MHLGADPRAVLGQEVLFCCQFSPDKSRVVKFRVAANFCGAGGELPFVGVFFSLHADCTLLPSVCFTVCVRSGHRLSC